MDTFLPHETSTSPVGTAAAPDSRAGDLFALGRAASAARRAHNAERGCFSRCKRLLPTGAWYGPRDAALAYVEERDLTSLAAARNTTPREIPLRDALEGAAAEGVRLLVASSAEGAAAARALGLRCVLEVKFTAGETTEQRTRTLERAVAIAEAGLDGIVPRPEGEPLGLDTLHWFATCRLAVRVPHVLADFVALGHRLAQMALGFGADELFGPIVSERALRLGANANNPAMTRREAALLLRGAGLVPHERLGTGALEEVVS